MTGRFEADPGPFLRPYAMTEGRTEPTGPDLAIEDLVGSAGAGEPPPWLSLEHRSIATACRETLSVAELAARVDLPLGVTRVLVGDLASQGMVTVHRAPSHTGGPNTASSGSRLWTTGSMLPGAGLPSRSGAPAPDREGDGRAQAGRVTGALRPGRPGRPAPWPAASAPPGPRWRCRRPGWPGGRGRAGGGR
jgi:hypothetical protein